MAIRIALICLLFGGCRKEVVSIPTCGTVKLEVPSGCKARAWGNGVEVDCPDGAKVYHCTALKAPSPQ